MKIILFALVFTSTALSAMAGISQEQFYSVMDQIEAENYDSSGVLIEQLGALYPDDPELFALNINYYFAMSRKDLVEIVPGQPPNDDTTLILRDSANNIAGYIRSAVQFDLPTLATGMDILKRGLAMHPDRLDLHFGLVYVSEAAELYDDMTGALLGILARAKENGGNWLWSFSEPLAEDPEEFVLEDVQSRIYLLFQMDSPHTDSLLATISQAMITTFPDRTYGHTNLGVLYSIQGDYESSLRHLGEAFRIDSTDMIVIANLADVNEKAGAVDKAVEYYNLMLKKGSPEDQTFARRQLERLGK